MDCLSHPPPYIGSPTLESTALPLLLFGEKKDLLNLPTIPQEWTLLTGAENPLPFPSAALSYNPPSFEGLPLTTFRFK